MTSLLLSQGLLAPCEHRLRAQPCQRPTLAPFAPQQKAHQPVSRWSTAHGAATTDAPAKAPEESTSVQQGSGSELSPEECTAIYRDMYLGREFEEMDHVHALSKKVPSREIMAELFGKKTGICRGQGGSMHMFSKEHGLLGGFAFIGEGIPVGLGAAYKVKYMRESGGDETADQVCCSFFGDGTANNGQFYECLNMASLYKLPCIFVVENNKWAIGMDHHRATARTEGDQLPFIYKKGPAFGMPGILVDGMDVRKVRQVAEEAIARARRGEGPTLIEAETYRFRGHSLADPDELREKAEKELWQKRDPLPTFKKYILEANIVSEADIKEIEKQVIEEVEESVKFADESPKPEKGQLLENVFADPKGFGIAADGRYRFEQAGFGSGTADV